jgi:transcriptional regulator with XRE-family HTH domain
VGADRHAETVNRVIAVLRDERKKGGLSQETLAKLAGLSRTGVRHVESANFRPTLHTLLKIAAALDVNLPRVISAAQKAVRSKA